jgi:predicted nucleic acid-binding Zn ribbon protein
MTFEPMGQVIHSLQAQQTWREYRQFQTLLQVWEDVVGKAVAAQTRPLWLTPQRILKVATSSAVWAQNLSFERHRILAKLNAKLNFTPPLADLHFSTRQWQSAANARLDLSADVAQISPFAIPYSQRSPLNQSTTSRGEIGESTQELDADKAFQQWSSTLKRRGRHLPLCRQCQCPTPAGELERWSVCALCAARTSGKP